MKNKSMMIVLVIAGLMMTMATQSLAWGARPKKPPRDKAFSHICRELELTDKQKEQFKDRQKKMETAMEARHDQMRKVGDKLKTEMEKDRPDRKVIHQLIREMNGNRVEMEIRRMDSLLEMRESLTPEQRKKFKRMMEKRKDHGNRGSRQPW